MIVYDGIKTGFLKSVEEDRIVPEIEQRILDRIGRHTAPNEVRSWENSLKRMYIVMNDPDIPDDAGVAIEYNIPQTAKRVDFMISGYDEQKRAGVIIIELKQWEKLNAVDGMDGLVETYINGGNHRLVHPSYQAWSYAQLIRDYNQTAQDEEIGLFPCAYLHNYQRQLQKDPVDAEQYRDYYEEAPVFTKGQVAQLRDFIKKSVRRGDNAGLLYKIEHGKIRPSKSLQNTIASMLSGNREFIMIDEQKIVYEEILKTSLKCQADQKKRTVIVQGGPGTGKTVVAMNLLSALTGHEQLVQYVTKNSAPRDVFKLKLKGNHRKNVIDNMFKSSGNYVGAPDNAAGTLLVDEAHRLNMKSGMFHNMGDNQTREIIHASLCSVFFIDESQRVTMDDAGSIDEIYRSAAVENAEVIPMELQSQFRCNGSDGYLAWLDHVLQIRDTANYDLDGFDYDFRVLDTPSAVYDLILEKNRAENRARMLAGYCWEWPKEKRNDTHHHDIVIGDFGMSWNLSDGEPFAVSETSVHEVGCIHTAQGLEFDYVGVIIGMDLRYENGVVVTDYHQRAKTDQSLKGIKKLEKTDAEEAYRKADEIIKNTYRTLMTRGMKGCYVYCCDSALGEHLKKRIRR